MNPYLAQKQLEHIENMRQHQQRMAQHMNSQVNATRADSQLRRSLASQMTTNDYTQKEILPNDTASH